MSLLAPLVVGAEAVLLGRFIPAEAQAATVDEKVTALVAAPAFVEHLLSGGTFFPSIRKSPAPAPRSHRSWPGRPTGSSASRCGPSGVLPRCRSAPGTRAGDPGR